MFQVLKLNHVYEYKKNHFSCDVEIFASKALEDIEIH